MKPSPSSLPALFLKCIYFFLLTSSSQRYLCFPVCLLPLSLLNLFFSQLSAFIIIKPMVILFFCLLKIYFLSHGQSRCGLNGPPSFPPPLPTPAPTPSEPAHPGLASSSRHWGSSLAFQVRSVLTTRHSWALSTVSALAGQRL